jgi:uncharacterized protein with PIN domain
MTVDSSALIAILFAETGYLELVGNDFARTDITAA